MRTLVDQLATYATYHRDPRNIATHFVGVPIIVLSVLILLSRVSVDVAGIAVTPALVVFLLSSLFYLKLSLAYGLAMFVIHGALLLVAGHFATLSTLAWLGAGVGIFVVGWIIQFVGHYYEGRKPAFVDDLIGLAIGPLFVVAELGFLIGMGKKTQMQVEAIAGPVRRRETASAYYYQSTARGFIRTPNAHPPLFLLLLPAFLTKGKPFVPGPHGFSGQFFLQRLARLHQSGFRRGPCARCSLPPPAVHGHAQDRVVRSRPAHWVQCP